MISNKKAESIGRILILSKKLDTMRGENFTLQKILGEKIYFQKGGKWYYDVEKLSKKTINELNIFADKINRGTK